MGGVNKVALDLGELRVRIGADLSEFSKGMSAAQQTIATAGAKFEKAGAGLNNAMSGFSKTASGLLVPTSALGKNLDDVGKAADKAGKHIHGATKPAAGLTGALTDMHNQMSLLFGGGALTAAFTAPFIGLAKSAFSAAISFESSFAGVRKTVSATEQEFAELEARFRSMAQEIPVSANELARIGELAGQLGVRGVDNISKFTEVIAKIGVSTNLSTEEAATSLARFANIMQMPIGEAGRLGSTIVDLGNNLATTEQEITTFALRIAGAGKQIGLSEAEVVGFGAALSAVGINAEAGGTAISRVFVKLANAVANGGEDLEEFAKVAGMTGQQFAREFRDNAAQATIRFIEGLKGVSDSGDNVFGVLEKLELQDIRVRDALLRTAGAGDLLRKAIDLASGAWENNTALNVEAAKRFATTESKLKVMKQRFEELVRTLGERAIPALTALIEKANGAIKAFNDMSPASQNTIIVLSGLFAAVGPVLLGLALLGSAISGITALTSVLSAVAIPALAGAMTFLVANPIGMLIVAIGTTLVAAGILLIQNFDEIKRNSLNAWGRIKAFIVDAAATIMEALARLNFANPLNKGFGDKALLQQYLNQAAALRDLADAERTVIDVRNLAAKGLTIADDVERLTGAYERNLQTQRSLNAEYREGDRAMRQGYIDAIKTTETAYEEQSAAAAGASAATIAMATAVDLVDQKLAALDNELATFKTQAGEAANSAEGLATQKDFLLRRIELLKERVVTLAMEYQRSVATTGLLSQETVDLAVQMDKARVDVASAEAEVRKLDLAMTEVTGPIADVKRELQQTETEIANMDYSINLLGIRLKRAQRDLKDTADEMKVLEDSTRDAERGISDALGAMENELRGIESQISKTEAALRGMAGIKLAGEGAIEEQLFNLQQDEARIRLLINRTKREGGAQEDVDALLANLEATLQQNKLAQERIELERELNIDPLRRELQKLTVDAKELTFDEARAQIQRYQTDLTNLQDDHSRLSERLKIARDSVDGLTPSLNFAKMSFDQAEEAVRTHKEQILANKAALEGPDGLTAKYAEQKFVVDTLNTALQIYGDRLDDAKFKQGELNTSLDNLRSAAQNAADALNRVNAPQRGGSKGSGAGNGASAPTSGAIDSGTVFDPSEGFAGPPITLTGPGLDALENAKRLIGDGKLDEAAKVLSDAYNIPLDQARANAERFMVTGPKFAEGAIVTRPTFGLMGEAGAEAIMPLRKLETLLSGFSARVMDAIGSLGGGGMGDFAFAGAGGGGGGMPAFDVRVFIGERELDNLVIEAQERNKRRGRTV